MVAMRRACGLLMLPLLTVLACDAPAGSLHGATGEAGTGASGTSGAAGGGASDTGGAPASNGGSGGAAAGAGGGAPAEATAVFAYNGAVVTGRGVEISAPILPSTTVIYQPFPTTLEGEKTMAHEASLLFDRLLVECAPAYPNITVDTGNGSSLSTTALASNYQEVARCAYDRYNAKPYWIPKLIDDVDICGTEMGSDWRLITEADLTGLSIFELQAVSDRWHLSTGTADQTFSAFFGSLQIWVRANDGSIARGTLAPDAATGRVSPLPDGLSPTDHYEGELGLRCIRGAGAP
jgi:hypothetical protein